MSEIGLDFVAYHGSGHTLSRYIAKKIIHLGFCAIPRPRHIMDPLSLCSSVGLISYMSLYKHKPYCK